MGSKNKNQKTCYIYTRVSTAMQVEGYSLDAQRNRILKETAHRGFKVIGEYSDEGYSGKNIKGRPEFQRMLKDIRTSKEKPDYVFVFKLSRFGRNAADVMNSIQYLEDYGVSLFCVEDSLDSAGQTSKLIMNILASVAEIERENIQIQTMAGRYEKACEGGWNGGMPPYGYRLENGKLIIEEAEAIAVRLIFDKFANENMGVNSIAKWLNSNGYKKIVRKNGTLDRFSSHFVTLVLDNPVYAGYIAYGRRKTEKITGSRNEFHLVKNNDYLITEGIHEAIIDRELWQITKAKRELNSYVREKRYSLEHAHVLSGLIKCPKCGAPMYGIVNRKKKKGKDEYYTDMWYYVCGNRRNNTGKSCDYSKHIRQDVLNREVIQLVTNIFNRVETAEDISKLVGTADNLDTLKKDLKRLEKVRSTEEQKKAKIKSKIMALDPSDELYESLYDDYEGIMRELSKNIIEYDEAIHKLNLSIENAKNKALTAEKIYKVMLASVQSIDLADDFTQRIFLQYLINSIQIYEKPQDDGRWVKSLQFRVELDFDGKIRHTVDWSDYDNSLHNETHDETCALLSRV